MATLHAPVVRDHRSERPRSSRPAIGERRALSWAAWPGVLAAVAGLLVTLVMPAASAAPPAAPTSAQSDRDAAAAEVERIEQLVTRAEDDLARFTVQAEAAADASRRAQAELADAQARAAASVAALEAAAAAVETARGDIADLGRESYLASDGLGTATAFLDSRGPADFLQRAATLDALGEDRAERLTSFEAVQKKQAEAEAAATAAVAERDDAAKDAVEAEAAAGTQLAQAQRSYDAVTAEKSVLDRKLQEAETELLRLQGAADARAAWAEGMKAARGLRDAALADAAAAAATGQPVAPATGRVTSCYGSRWGTMHYGVDIAASIGTPIHAPADGRVLQAGPASGFGLAVYVQHADGSITVYGHINDHFVTAGELVTAGQRIAEVGNTGQSTGPHLHFEVHTGGLYQNRVDPGPWLAARGVSLGGGC